MHSIDVAYFEGRASAERQLAMRADVQKVAAIHQELARQYEALAERLEQGPNPWADSSSN